MRKHSLQSARLAAGALGLILAAAVPARAYTFADCLWDLNTCRSDRDLFLSLALRDSGVTRPVLEPVLPRVRNVYYDLPVILFVSRNTGRPVDAIIDLRARGLTWAQVFRQLGLGYDPLFVDLTVAPAYPYRTAWTYWRRNPATVRLTDVQVRDLVQLQYGHRLTGIPVVEVARARARGRSPVVLVAEKHGRTYAAVGVPPGHGGIPPGHGGVPPGRVKSGVPPGHRKVTTAVVAPVVVERHETVKVKTKARGHADKDEGDEHGHGKGHGEGKGKGKGEGKGKDEGHGKH
jgi:hypothetical protein